MKDKPLRRKILDYLMDTSLDIFDLGVKIIFKPEDIVGGLVQFRKYSHPKQFSNLKNSPYFEYKNNEFYLTKSGRIEIIKNIIKYKKGDEEWDGKWRAIIFDIPEANRKERNFLRRELKWMGLKELQHSIWITHYDMEKEFLSLLKLWHKDFKGDIRFLKIEKIVDDKDFIKEFDLVV